MCHTVHSVMCVNSVTLFSHQCMKCMCIIYMYYTACAYLSSCSIVFILPPCSFVTTEMCIIYMHILHVRTLLCAVVCAYYCHLVLLSHTEMCIIYMYVYNTACTLLCVVVCVHIVILFFCHNRWYKPNYELADPLRFGQNMGCDWVLSGCLSPV